MAVFPHLHVSIQGNLRVWGVMTTADRLAVLGTQEVLTSISLRDGAATTVLQRAEPGVTGKSTHP